MALNHITYTHTVMDPRGSVLSRPSSPLTHPTNQKMFLQGNCVSQHFTTDTVTAERSDATFSCYFDHETYITFHLATWFVQLPVD